MAMSTVKRRTRPSFLTAAWFADEFAKVEEKDCRVSEVRVRAVPPGLVEDAMDRRDGKLFMWGAEVVVDRRMKAGEVVLRCEELLEPVVPVKVRKKTVKGRTMH